MQPRCLPTTADVAVQLVSVFQARNKVVLRMAIKDWLRLASECANRECCFGQNAPSSKARNQEDREREASGDEQAPAPRAVVHMADVRPAPLWIEIETDYSGRFLDAVIGDPPVPQQGRRRAAPRIWSGEHSAPFVDQYPDPSSNARPAG